MSKSYSKPKVGRSLDIEFSEQIFRQYKVWSLWLLKLCVSYCNIILLADVCGFVVLVYRGGGILYVIEGRESNQTVEQTAERSTSKSITLKVGYNLCFIRPRNYQELWYVIIGARCLMTISLVKLVFFSFFSLLATGFRFWWTTVIKIDATSNILKARDYSSISATL